MENFAWSTYFDLVCIFLFPYLSEEYYNNIITVNHYTCTFVHGGSFSNQIIGENQTNTTVERNIF